MVLDRFTSVYSIPLQNALVLFGGKYSVFSNVAMVLGTFNIHNTVMEIHFLHANDNNLTYKNFPPIFIGLSYVE